MANHQHWFISEVLVSNFKSFCLPTTVRFGYHSNQILGPNGAGKSNVLDALAFAAGAPCEKLRVTKLTQLTNSSHPANQSSVEFCVTKRNIHHRIKCALTKEGTREFKIDGKIKSLSQVTAFLGELGIRLGSSSIIRQGDITTMASSEASALARLVADASGLTSFREESKRGQTEIAAARKTQETIQKNMKKIEAASSEVTRRMKNEKDRVEIESKIIQVVRSLHSIRCAHQAEIDEQIQVAELARDTKGKEIERSRQALSNVLALIKQIEIDREGKRREKARVVDELALVSSLMDALGDRGKEMEARNAARSRSEAEIDALKLDVRKKKSLLDLATSALERDEGVLSGLSLKHQGAEGLLELKRTAEERVEEARESLARGARELKDASARVVACAEKLSELERISKASAAAREEIERMRVEMGFQGSENASIPLSDLLRGGVDSESSAMVAAKSRLQALRQILDTGRQQYDRESLLLHQSFTFTRVAVQTVPREGLIRSLAVILGSSLFVTICPSSRAALRIIEAHSKSPRGKMRLWPLDTLRVAIDRDEEKRRTIKALCPGSAWLPSDLVSPPHPSYLPAIKRAIGSLVIATDKEAASKLSARGIECVTFDGVSHRQGSISFTFRGTGSDSSSVSPSEHLLRMKLEAFELELRSKSLEGRVRKLREMLKRVEEVEGEMGRMMDSDQISEEIDRVSLRVKEEKEEEGHWREVCAAGRRRVLDEEKQLQELMRAGSDEGVLRTRVQEGLRLHRKERDRLEEEVMEMEMQVEEMETLLALPPASHGLELIPTSGQNLDELQCKQKVLDEDKGQLEKEIDEMERAIKGSSRKAEEEEGKVAALKLALLALEAEGGRLFKARDKVRSSIRDLLSKVPSEKRTLITGGRGQEDRTTGGGEEQIQRLQGELEELGIKRSRIPPDAHVSEADRSVHASQMVSLDELKGHESSLRQAIDSLGAQIRTVETVALAKNNETCGRIATSFTELCSLFLPSFTLSLHKIMENDASQGLKIECCRKIEEREGGGEISMDVLSGGQRSMMAMALLLSAARQGSQGGGHGSSVLMLDEVDAALDQNNQELLGTLLAQLKGIQVISVSHNASFQLSAGDSTSTIIRITKGPDGHSAIEA